MNRNYLPLQQPKNYFIQNLFRIIARARTSSLVLAAPRSLHPSSTLTQPLHVPSPPCLPTFPPHFPQEMRRFTCGRALLGRSRRNEADTKGGKGRQCSSGKGTTGKSKGKGSQCSEVKSNKGNSEGKQCNEVKGKRNKSNERGQCSTIKGKEKKGGQCSTIKGRSSKDDGVQCSSVKGKRGISKEKGRQCSDVKGKKDKVNEKHKQCSEVKGKKDKARGKGAQCTEVKGKQKEIDTKPSFSDCSCSTLDSVNDAAKAATVICEGNYTEDKPAKTYDTCSSSSSSSSSSESESESKEKDETSGDEKVPHKECVEEPLDHLQEEKNLKAVTEMCACIQSALAQTKSGQVKDKTRNSLNETKQASSCGSSHQEDKRPNMSEHVKCCQIETSKTAPSNASGNCKIENHDKHKEQITKPEEVDDLQENMECKPKSTNDPCECIKKALENCSKGVTTVKTKSEPKKPDDKPTKYDKKVESSNTCPTTDKYSKEDTSDEETSQCGPGKHGTKKPPFC